MIKVDQYQLIRELYAVKGVSQREIARRLGISRNTVKKYCNGENLPSVDALNRMKRMECPNKSIRPNAFMIGL
ncbi:MAG TPA: hypothetical protein DDZ66_05225 [Firmicutes bacterium]|nr:hypothetical protein [Bacillota bacterium]